MTKHYLVLQDGKEFYDDETGRLLYRAGIHVGQDLRAAQQARAEFIDFATRQGWTVQFD